MTLQALLRTCVSIALLASVAACTGVRGPVLVSPPDDQVPGQGQAQVPVPQQVPGAVEAPITGTAPPPVDLPPLTPPPASNNAAVVALLDSAHTDAGAGRLPTATASLERALRIEPRNANLWHELAKLELQKGEYRKAENLAARSNSWAGTNKALMAKNWRLIGEARSLRGDNPGAKAALARAQSFE